jgi:hypothetical protein
MRNLILAVSLALVTGLAVAQVPTPKTERTFVDLTDTTIVVTGVEFVVLPSWSCKNPVFDYYDTNEDGILDGTTDKGCYYNPCDLQAPLVCL